MAVTVKRKGGTKKETKAEKKARLAAEAAAKKAENQKKAEEKAEIRKAHKEGVAQDAENTRQQNQNLSAAQQEYRQSKRSEESKIELEEARAIKKSGSWFKGTVAGESDAKKREETRKKFSKGGYIKYRKGGKMKDC